jgi:hypothetical protein
MHFPEPQRWRLSVAPMLDWKHAPEKPLLMQLLRHTCNDVALSLHLSWTTGI